VVSRNITSDVLVLGGGPAGSAAARLLALWGHDVRLVTPPTSASSPALAESLPPSCGKLFGLLGVEREIEEAGFIRSTGNTVWWGEGEGRIESFASGERGWQVTTGVLASVLLESARAAGVLVQSARATIEQVSSAGESIVLDCTGRTGLMARARGWRVYEPALKTVALVGVWRHDTPLSVPDSTHTLIESYSDGWLWSVPAASDARYLAAMVDPRISSLDGDAARDIYLNEVRKARRLAALTAQARFDAGPWGWDASMYSSSHYADDRVLLVGDAGSFIDPLSSAGVKKALASGWLAAVAAHTALIRPSMRQVAFDFFAAREREIYERFRSLTQRYLADAAGGHAHPFWTDREFPDQTPVEDITSAFAHLRAAPELKVGVGEVHVEDRPAISGCEVVVERRLVDRAHPEGVRYLHDVDVLALVELAPAHRDVGELFDAYVRRQAPVALPDFLRALATLLARGWLVWI
jgi:FAD-dependent halogenase